MTVPTGAGRASRRRAGQTDARRADCVPAHIGVPRFVPQTSGNAAEAGVMAFFGMLPLVIATLAGRPVTDRTDRLRAFRSTETGGEEPGYLAPPPDPRHRE